MKKFPNYKKPKISKQKLKFNLFSSNSRFMNTFDQFNDFFVTKVYASFGCLLPGTKVILADGSEEKIQNLKQLQEVLSYNIQKNIYSKNRIVKKLVHASDVSEIYITINKTIKITPNHRVWVNGNTWKRVDDLRIGDWLLGPSHTQIPVQVLESQSNHSKVYNLVLQNSEHDYFADKILVHNGEEVPEKWP